MRDYAIPAPGVTFLTGSAAQSLDQIHDRLQCELNSHQRRPLNWETGKEPNVELTLDEARIMVKNLSRASHLLRLASEGLLS